MQQTLTIKINNLYFLCVEQKQTGLAPSLYNVKNISQCIFLKIRLYFQDILQLNNKYWNYFTNKTQQTDIWEGMPS